MSSRRSFTAELKLEAIAYAKTHGNRETGRHFDVSEKTIRDWKKIEDKLNKCEKNQKAFRGRKAKWPHLEEILAKWVVQQRSSGVNVTAVQIRRKAVDIAKELGITCFCGGVTWCERFMRRKSLSRRKSAMLQQLVNEAATFRASCYAKIESFNIGPDYVINVDEVPLSFDTPVGDPDDLTEASSNSSLTGYEKTSFTIILAVTAAGDKLPPMVIFQSKIPITGNFPQGILVHDNDKGCVDNQMMRIWIRDCFLCYADGLYCLSPSLLLMDSTRPHITNEAESLLKDENCHIAVIPSGLNKMLQPLDITVKQEFKAGMRLNWEAWSSSEQHSFTKTGRLRRVSFVDLSTWILTSWENVSVSCIRNGFRKAKIFTQDESLSNSSSVDDDDNDDDDDEDDGNSSTASVQIHSGSDSENFPGLESDGD